MMVRLAPYLAGALTTLTLTLTTIAAVVSIEIRTINASSRWNVIVVRPA